MCLSDLSCGFIIAEGIGELGEIRCSDAGPQEILLVLNAPQSLRTASRFSLVGRFF